MKISYNIILPAIFIGLTTFSCSRTDNNQTHGNPVNTIPENITKDTFSINKKIVAVQQSDFDLTKFIALTDSHLTSIQGKSISLTYKIDSITATETDMRSYFKVLNPSDNNIIKRYFFDPGKNDRELSFWFVEATYKDTISTNQAFDELRKQSGRVNGTDDFLPGLTYQNDYVIIVGKKIYWLNSSCSFAFYNHQKLKQNLIESLKVNNIQDSIWCKCGQAKCSL